MNEISTKTDTEPTAVQSTNTSAGGFLNIIAAAAADPNFDLARMERLFAMQRQVMADEAMRAFQEAMAQAQAEMPSVVKNAENPHLKSKYAQLEAIDDAIRPVYTRHGFSLMFSQRDAQQAGDMIVVCTILHKAGHSITQSLPGKVDTGPGRSANQAVGSAISYLRRYLTLMIFNVVVRNEDKDGNAIDTGELITPEQKARLVEFLKKLPPDATPDFLRNFCKVESLDAIPASLYRDAETALRNAVRKGVTNAP